MAKRRVVADWCAALTALIVLTVPGTLVGQTPHELVAGLEKRRAKVRTLDHVTRTISREGTAIRETTTRSLEKVADKGVKSRQESTVKTTDKSGKQTSTVKAVTVSDGTYEWREMPVGDRMMVFKSKVSRRNPLGDVKRTLGLGRARIKGHESIHRESCVVLEVLAGSAERFRATYWISESYGVVLKSVILKADSSRTEMDTVEFKVNSPIEDGKFVYRPPDGATVVDTDNLGGTGGSSAKP